MNRHPDVAEFSDVHADLVSLNRTNFSLTLTSTAVIICSYFLFSYVLGICCSVVQVSAVQIVWKWAAWTKKVTAAKFILVCADNFGLMSISIASILVSILWWYVVHRWNKMRFLLHEMIRYSHVYSPTVFSCRYLCRLATVRPRPMAQIAIRGTQMSDNRGFQLKGVGLPVWIVGFLSAIIYK